MSAKYCYDRYVNVKSLLDQHKALIERDDYVDSNRWMEHLEQDLMKFWLKPGALETKGGLWRTFLTDDGKSLPGLDKLGEWPKDFREAIKKLPNGEYATEAGDLLEGADKNADYNFVRSHSRQVFAYGIAYNMTGNQKYFELCSKGAHVLLDLVDKQSGAMYTKQRLNDGSWVDDVDARTSQDLAYGMTGIAFYYYLTHDKQALEIILKLKDYIFKTYYSPGKDIFTWLPKSDNSKNQSVELVSHLDQLYAYMLWLTPSLPQPYKDEYKADMKHIAHIMIERFYTEVYGTFWGTGNSPEMKVLGTAHSDFGHSVKAMWVIYMVGVWTGETYYINFARKNIYTILENAFDEGTGAWNRRILPDGSIDKDKEWWSLAELDQAASLLALTDPTYVQYINRTYPFWFKNMVDTKNGEIWHVLDGESLMPKRIFPKAHCWKTSLHSFEHTLFCYLTSKQLLSEKFSLYYAFESLEEVQHQTVTPYFFKGNIYAKEETGGIRDGDKKRVNIKVTFDSLH